MKQETDIKFFLSVIFSLVGVICLLGAFIFNTNNSAMKEDLIEIKGHTSKIPSLAAEVKDHERRITRLEDKRANKSFNMAVK